MNPIATSTNPHSQRTRWAALFAVLSISTISTNAWAQQNALLRGPAAFVTAEDIQAAAQRIPKASRAAVFSRSENVLRQAEDIYGRRLLALEAEKSGLDKEPVVQALLRQARERILSDAQLVEVSLAATPAEADVTRYAQDVYKSNPDRFKTAAQTRASHILISRTEDGKARAKAEELLARLKEGASFEALAKEHSADLASAAKGGDLDWFKDGAMVKEFQDAVAALKQTGEISPLVETQFGFHIIRLDGRRPAGLRAFEEVRAELEAEVRVKAQTEARKAKMRALLETAKVDDAAIRAVTGSFAKP